MNYKFYLVYGKQDNIEYNAIPQAVSAELKEWKIENLRFNLQPIQQI